MVFVVASHTMVVNANTNPDGTMKRSKTPNLPKSDLRGAWKKEDPRLAVQVSTGRGQGGHTYVTKATSVRTHEDHTGSGKRVRHEQLFGREEPLEELEFGRRGRSVGGLTQVRGRQLGLTGSGGRTDALLASRGLSSSSYEPLSTVTEKFKSVTTRQPTVTQQTQPAAPRYDYEYHAPVFSSVSHKPPVPGLTSSRPRVSGVSPASRSRAPSSALVPYQKSSALYQTTNYEDEYEEAQRQALRSRSEQIARRQQQDRLFAPSRPPHSPVIPQSYRGLSLIASAHERDSRDYTIPARRSIHHPVLPTFGTAPRTSGGYLAGRTYPYTAASASMTATPSGFYRGRRHSLPGRPSEVLMDSYTDDLYDPYTNARRHDAYLPPRTTSTPLAKSAYQVTTVPAPRSYSPMRTHYSPVLPRRSRVADIEASLEATYMPETASTYAGLRSRAADARSKIDMHKTMMDRYLPVHLGPEKDVGMPRYETYRPSTIPSKVTPYRPVSRPERRMSLPSTPSRVVAPAPPRRAPMSDARKRAREVLCKTKRDPEYYSY